MVFSDAPARSKAKSDRRTSDGNPTSITLNLDEEALLMCHVEIGQCRHLLHQLDVLSTSAQEAGVESPGEVSESDERNVPLWLQMLDVKTALLLKEDDG
jgi:hypothetical protein